MTSTTCTLAWNQGSCSVRSLLIAKLEIGKHIRPRRGVKVCYAPVKFCKFSQSRRIGGSGTLCGAPHWYCCRKGSGIPPHEYPPGSHRPGRHSLECVFHHPPRTWGTGSTRDGVRRTYRPRQSYPRASACARTTSNKISGADVNCGTPLFCHLAIVVASGDRSVAVYGLVRSAWLPVRQRWVGRERT